MPKFKIYGNRSKEETPLELANRQIARQIAREGMVLLENDGTLPLSTKKLSLFGGGARLTIKGGSGSGDVRERYSVNIEEGLKNSGIEIVNTNWLNRFTETYEKDKKEFREMVEKEIKGYPVWKVMDMFKKIGQFKLDYPVGDEIVETDITEKTDVCVYVIARQAGEGFDRKRIKGDYLLSDLEVNNLKFCREHFEKLVVVVNSGAALDLSPLSDIGVNALVYYGQAGEEGGNALGEILVGEVNPSGKLTDTWALQYEDYPIMHINHDEKLEENYEEGIYVGYRYFDAKQIMPKYPFGHGLSYTSFSYKCIDANTKDSTVTIRVSVTNKGQRDGSDTVFAFLGKPNKKYYGEVKSLAAFRKTRILKPNEEEILELSFAMEDFAVYDEVQHSFILEEGDYPIAIGRDALHYEVVAAVSLQKDVIAEVCKNLVVKKKEFKDYEFRTPGLQYEGSRNLEVTIPTRINHYDYQLPKVSNVVQSYLDTLRDEELAMFTMGGGYFTKQYIKVLGSCGNTTSLLMNKGIPGIIMADGPAGINIMPEVAYTKRGGTRYINDIPEEWKWGWLKTVMPKLKFLYANKNDTPCYQYCTALPNATMMAQTFNTDLIEKAGEGIGKEMLTMGVTLWLAPALNIHRDPLCGRNFEYYSEDPIVSGLMAKAMTKGVQKNPGVGVTIKHFACNNREDDRIHVSSNVSERALREIYLKGFQIAVREKPMAIMSSYNRINGTYAPNSRELLIDILRCEWGYEGLVMSDWDAVDQCSYTLAVKNGNNMIMPGTKEVYNQIVSALKNHELSREEVKVSALYALKMIFEAKTTKDYLEENRRG